MEWQHGCLFVSLESWNLKALTFTHSLLSCITAATVTFEICANFKFCLFFLLSSSPNKKFFPGEFQDLIFLYYKTIISLFLYLYFSSRDTSYSLICASHRSHNEFARDENNMNKTVKMFFTTSQKSVVFKVSINFNKIFIQTTKFSEQLNFSISKGM